MFIKKVKKSKKSTSVRIVKNTRDKDGKVKQELIKIVGTAQTEEEVQILERAAREIILSLHPLSLRDVIKSVHEIPDDIRLNNIKEFKRVNDGIIDIFGPLYDECGFGNIISKTRRDKQWNEILKFLVLARIAHPTSKRKTTFILSRKFLTNIPLDKIYRAMDRVHLVENEIRLAVSNHTSKISLGKINVLLFDVTTLYFESFSNDELRGRGFSKDCKFKEVQVVLSLTTTEKGLPIDYTLFPGNTYEGSTLIETIKKLKNQYQVSNVTLVADRGMFNEKNLIELETTGIKYIVACKLRSLSKTFKNNILTDNDYRANIVEGDLCWAKNYDYKERRIVVNYSSKRAKKDKHHREMLIERIIKKTKNGKIKIDELITNHGSKKFIKKINGKVEIDQQKITNDALWDGLHGIITNDEEADTFSLLSQYRQLWRIEESFRINKHDLKMRPIFHWKPERVKAHISICYLAFSLSKYAIEKLKLGGVDISLVNLREELYEIESSLLMDQEGSGKPLYLLPSPLNEVQHAIYSIFDVNRRMTPWCA